MGDDTSSKFKRICVFCGSNSGNRPVFRDAALDLGLELVQRRIELVYGGGSIGLMGLISQTVHDGGCHVLGVIPKALVPIEISGETVGEVKIVSDMHERKAEMARQADAFIALPGGYGTMEEVLEMITWSQLGIHNKPIGLLNVDGYYNSLFSLFDNGVEEGFIKPACRDIVLSASTAHELLEKMEVDRPSTLLSFLKTLLHSLNFSSLILFRNLLLYSFWSSAVHSSAQTSCSWIELGERLLHSTQLILMIISERSGTEELLSVDF